MEIVTPSTPKWLGNKPTIISTQGLRTPKKKKGTDRDSIFFSFLKMITFSTFN